MRLVRHRAISGHGRRNGFSLRAVLRTVAILFVAGLALHELRYMSWLGAESHHHGGASHGLDGPLSILAPALTMLVALVFAGMLVVLAQSGRGSSASRVRMRNLWPIATGGLLAVFSIQELAQGALDESHPFGLHGMFGHGGWIVVPLALLLGAIVAMAIGVVRELDRRCSWAGILPMLWAGSADLVGPYRAPRLPGRPLADNLAGRSPPFLVV